MEDIYSEIVRVLHSGTPAEIAISIMAELIKVRAENAKEGAFKKLQLLGFDLTNELERV